MAVAKIVGVCAMPKGLRYGFGVHAFQSSVPPDAKNVSSPFGCGTRLRLLLWPHLKSMAATEIDAFARSGAGYFDQTIRQLIDPSQNEPPLLVTLSGRELRLASVWIDLVV